MKKHLVRNLAVLGGALVVASIAFEYVRMNPSYRLIVEPWSIRGYELTQGTVVAALGVASIILSLLAASDRGSTVFNAIVGFGVWLAAVLIAQFPDPPPVNIELAPFFSIVITAALALILTKTILNMVGDRFAGRSRRYASVGTLALVFLIGYLWVANPNFVAPNSAELDLSVIVAVVMGIIVVAAIAAEPKELAVARIAIVSALVSWIVIATIGTGARANLIQEQLEIMGVSGTYRDTQITSGLMVAFAGMFIVFLASVGLWAHKRDRLQVAARARRQQEAAAESAAELAQASARSG